MANRTSLARAGTRLLPGRTSVVVELLSIGGLATWFVATFTTRPSYVDGVAALLAVALIGLSTRRSAAIWRLHAAGRGPGRSNLHAASRWMIAFTGAVLLLFFAAGLYLGREEAGWSGAWGRVLNWHILVAMALYLPWALLQQFIFQFYLLGRLLMLAPAWLAIMVTALAFSAVHFPRTPVMAVTLIAGSVWALTYYKHRVLLPIAASHALLGAALHYWIFGRDLLDRWLPPGLLPAG